MTITENFNLADVVKNALRDALKERGHVNILIAGRSGVGKSTLINAIFQGNLATTGQGRPVTQNTREIKKECRFRSLILVVLKWQTSLRRLVM